MESDYTGSQEHLRGAVIHGHYKVKCCLKTRHQDNMPEWWHVYQCINHENGEQVVVKQANAASDTMAEMLFSRMADELDGMFTCEHYEQEPVALVSAFVEGKTLEDWLCSHPVNANSPWQVLKVFRTLAKELDDFWQRNGHRLVDVRPSQVMVTPQEECRLLPSACSLYTDETVNLDVLNFAQLVYWGLTNDVHDSQLLLKPVESYEFSGISEACAACLLKGLRGEFASCRELLQELTACYGTIAECGSDYKVKLAEGVELQLKWIAPGEFMMGSPLSEVGRNPKTDEVQHRCTIEDGFWLGVFPVTQREFQSVMGNEIQSRYSGDDHPMDQLAWQDARKFCDALNDRQELRGGLPDGYCFALPTERQWEYACRAGSQTALYNNRNLETDEIQSASLNALAWYNGNKRERNKEILTEVGRRQPNDWGLHDLLGNVWEWTRDTSDNGEDHWARGGDARSAPRDCRCASRRKFEDGERGLIGMRLAIVRM